MAYCNLKDSSDKIKQPKELKIKLYPHQLTSIAAMSNLEKLGSIIIDKPPLSSELFSLSQKNIHDIDEYQNSKFTITTNSAILGDKVGSGKTFMIIGLLIHNKVPVSHQRLIAGNEHYMISMKSNKESNNINLIVTPHNLCNQWEDFIKFSSLKYLKLNTVAEFEDFYDISYVDFEYYEKRVYYTKVKSKEILYQRRILNYEKKEKKLKGIDVIILNINRYSYFKEVFESEKWARVIVDEMDSIKFPRVFNEYGNFNWFMTATPTSIFSKSCRFYVNRIFGHNSNLIDFFIVKNKDKYVEKSIILPPPHIFIINTLLNRVISAIKEFIPKQVLDLINSGNIKEAVTYLNCQVDTQDNIIDVLTSNIRRDLDNLKKKLKYTRSLNPINVANHKNKIRTLKEEIQRCNIKLESIYEKINSIKNECCLICTEQFDNPTVLNCCKTVLCFACLIESLTTCRGTCPYCREKVDAKNGYHVISAEKQKKNKKKEKKEEYFNECDKSVVFSKILNYIAKNNKNPRILICSDFPKTFDNILVNIKESGLTYAFLSGTPGHINNIINNFKNENLNIILLDTKHYGSGLNLQCADYVILYHRMSTELETQVIGRAQRYGRKHPLRIIYLTNNLENQNTNLSDNPVRPNTLKDLSLLNID